MRTFIAVELSSELKQHLGDIDQLPRQQRSFTAELNGFGFFPSPKRPRILYAAIKEPLSFKQLAQHLDRLLEPLGFTPEQHFIPHITLARIKSTEHPETIRQLTNDIALQRSFCVDTVSLFGSTLGADGARYHVLRRALL